MQPVAVTERCMLSAYDVQHQCTSMKIYEIWPSMCSCTCRCIHVSTFSPVLSAQRSLPPRARARELDVATACIMRAGSLPIGHRHPQYRRLPHRALEEWVSADNLACLLYLPSFAYGLKLPSWLGSHLSFRIRSCPLLSMRAAT